MVDVSIIALGALVFAIAMVAIIGWIAKRLGSEESRREAREQDAETMRRLSKIMARRDRTRGELTHWMREQGNGDRPSMPPRKRRGR